MTLILRSKEGASKFQLQSRWQFRLPFYEAPATTVLFPPSLLNLQYSLDRYSSRLLGRCIDHKTGFLKPFKEIAIPLFDDPKFCFAF